MRVVICDDDAHLRQVIASLGALDAHEVVAETDHAMEAADLVERFEADLLILDLSLGFGGGKDVLDLLRERDVPCEVVVFTAFAGERASVLQAGARAVVEKPNFPLLEREIEAAGHAVDDDELGGDAPRRERRRPTAARSLMPPVLRTSPSGIEARHIFAAALDASIEGDEMLVVSLEGLDQIGAGRQGDLIAADHLLALARCVRETIRTQDRLSIDDDGNLVVVLVGGVPGTTQRVFTRLEAAWDTTQISGTIRAGWAARTDDDTAAVTMARAEGALATGREHRLERLIRG